MLAFFSHVCMLEIIATFTVRSWNSYAGGGCTIDLKGWIQASGECLHRGLVSNLPINEYLYLHDPLPTGSINRATGGGG